MQIINDLKGRAQQFVEENATTLLTAGGVVGVVGTAVLAFRGGYKTYEAMLQDEARRDIATPADGDTPPLTKLDEIKLAAPHILYPAVTGGLTIAAIVLANRMNGQKAAALAAAYGLSQRQLEEYKAKVAEKLGVAKAQKVDDELAQERVDNTPGANNIVVVEGEVLCFDEPTGRYFRSTMENINQAVNSTNAEILHHEQASASYFYEELGLPATTWSDEVGWNRDHLVELKISTVLAPDQKPCIAIDFKTLPKLDYVPKHY